MEPKADSLHGRQDGSQQPQPRKIEVGSFPMSTSHLSQKGSVWFCWVMLLCMGWLLCTGEWEPPVAGVGVASWGWHPFKARHTIQRLFLIGIGVPIPGAHHVYAQPRMQTRRQCMVTYRWECLSGGWLCGQSMGCVEGSGADVAGSRCEGPECWAREADQTLFCEPQRVICSLV